MTYSNKKIFRSKILSDATPRKGGSEYWRALFYLNIYRMLLAVFFVTTSLATINVGSLGSKEPEIFAYFSFSYALVSILFIFIINRGWPSYITQCRLQILTDIVIVTALYYASAGRGAGLEMLLFISVSASGILLGGRGALAAASTATILLILEHFYVIATNQRPLGGFTTLGFIGVGLFVTAFIIYYLSLLLRKTEGEVAQQHTDIQKLNHINELIVEQLHSGVIVVDSKYQVLLINNSIKAFFSIPDTLELPQGLEELLKYGGLDKNKLNDIIHQKKSMFTLSSGKKLLSRYMPLGNSYENGFIILFDDFSQVEEEQRNEKFISMGRLSASIAHEIRNPLGAISHAGQLLAESPEITNDDIRLVEIIEKQSSRINQTIQTILDLGQQNDQNFSLIQLHVWLLLIIKTFCKINNLSEDSILLRGDSTLTAYGDPEQLQHVIQNLLSNSLRYADTSQSPFICIGLGVTTDRNSSNIKVEDNGSGIPLDIQDKIFEPFFTTYSKGNGLGLYIARKICLSNDGYLDYIHTDSDNNYFELTLTRNNARAYNHQNTPGK